MHTNRNGKKDKENMKPNCNKKHVSLIIELQHYNHHLPSLNDIFSISHYIADIVSI